MRRIFLLAVCLLCIQTGKSCDFCNCYLGLNPGYNNNSIGIRWKNSHTFLQGATQGLRISHIEHGSESEPLVGDWNEYENELELYGRYYPHPKVQLMFTMPYLSNTITYTSEREHLNAFGDLFLQGFYQLANTRATDSTQTRHRLFGGGGIKFPTGKSSGTASMEVPMAHHLLPGTGSTDYLASLSYIGKKQLIGWNVDASYKFNGSSSTGYHYGNTLNLSGSGFYTFLSGKVALYPHIGSAYESGLQDSFNGETVRSSGGATTWGTAGCDLYFGSFAIANQIRLPLLMHIPEGTPEDHLQLALSFSYNF